MFSFGETQVLTIKKKTQLQRGQLDTPGALCYYCLVYVLLLPCMKKKEKKRERNPIYNRFFNKVVVIVFLFTGL